MNFTIEKSIQILEKTPTVLKTLLQDISSDWTFKNEGGETWSAYDVIGHLIEGEKTDWTARMDIILSNDDNKNFIPFNRFSQFDEVEEKSLTSLLDEFEILRKKTIKHLIGKKLTDHDLKKEGIHPDFGRVTLAQLLSTWVVHDLNHIAQISRVMAFQYKSDVGSWIQYLGIYKTPSS